MAQTFVSLAELGPQGLSRSFCSAVLISDGVVVTAAHCLSGKEASHLFVVLGTDGFQSQVLRPARKLLIHPGFQFYGDQLPAARDNQDIALLFFDGEIPNGYRPAILATSLQAFAQEGRVSIAGFGNPNRGILSACDTAVENASFSRSEIELFGYSSCSPNGGDSGGPVYRVVGDRVVLFAIHNWGWHDDSGSPLYSVEASIPTHAAWIRLQLRADHQESPSWE